MFRSLQDLCQTTIIGLGWLVLFQVIVGLLLMPLLVCVIEEQQASMGWYSMNEFINLVGLEAKVTRLVIGTLMARCGGVREDLGMNLMVEARGDKGALCLPCYSIKQREGWYFSNLAVSALKDYYEKFPGVFKAPRLQHTSGEGGNLSERGLIGIAFGGQQLLRLTPAEYMAMTVESVDKELQLQKGSRSRRRKQRTVVGVPHEDKSAVYVSLPLHVKFSPAL
eukprot:Skav204762  [mRNA]  locus=scaffold1013:295437:306133:+ [translate_table: standard]